MSKKIFLLGDVDSIKSYVFEAPGLPQIRGGSQRLVECEEKVKNCVKQLGGKEIYCSGGGFLFEVPVDKAEKVKRSIERIYLEHTLVATVTVVYEDASQVPPSAPDITITNGWADRLVKTHRQIRQTGEFARRTAFLAARLREAKQQKATAPFIEAFPFGKRCDICGKRVAEKEVPYPDETKRVCGVCHQRYEKGKKERKVWFQRFTKALNLELQAEVPQDLNELVESAHRDYLAFLYADGNNIGSLLQKVKDEREYKALSDTLKESTQKALFEALWEECQQTLQKEKILPFEIVNIGGDDVTLLIQAGYAWDIALSFLEKFESYVQEEVEKRLEYWPEDWPKPITASVGIAIADAKHPVRYLEALAEDLLKKAKKTAKKENTSAINFLWLPNAIAVTKAEMVADLYRRNGFVLTARPYTLAQARMIQEVANVLSQWPRSLRHRWGEALERGRWFALNLILYDLARRMNEKHEKDKVNKLLSTLEKLVHVLGGSSAIPIGYLWWSNRENNEEIWCTPLLDALELAELKAMRPDIQEEIEEAA